MFDATNLGGPGGYPRCCCCDGPILGNQRSIRIDFATDPHGHEGLTGFYHEHCSKPFQALAKVVNLNCFGRF